MKKERGTGSDGFLQDDKKNACGMIAAGVFGVAEPFGREALEGRQRTE